MPQTEFETFLNSKGAKLASPIAVILAEDEIELVGTVEHHDKLGFRTILVLGDIEGLEDPEKPHIHIFPIRLHRLEDSVEALNLVIDACPGKWIYYCFNAEYLFFPLCEHRSIGDAVTFMVEERRDAVFTYAIDLYPENLADHRSGVDIGSAHLDSSGYYGMDRFEDGEMIERQPEVFGGLRWRFEEHIPWEKRRIDRICLFKASKDLHLDHNLRLSDTELNTISCEWHNNLTMAVMSFRVAKALMHNPGSAEDIDNFFWGGSQKFEWNSNQLMELGFMEPGQWF